jgi:hypothetical protein
MDFYFFSLLAIHNLQNHFIFKFLIFQLQTFASKKKGNCEAIGEVVISQLLGNLVGW